MKPKISLIFPVYGQSALLLNALSTLRKLTKYPNYEIILVDDCSREKMDAVYDRRDLYDKLLRLKSNTGNSTVVVNEGVKISSGELIQYQNTDVYFEDPEWLDKVVDCFDEETAVVGPALLYPDGTVQSAGMFFDRKGLNHHLHRYKLYETVRKRTIEVPMVAGCGLTTRRDVYDRLGGFRVFRPHGWDDADWCLRVRKAGYKVKLCLAGSFYHIGTVSYSGADTAQYHRNRKRILREFDLLIRQMASSKTPYPKYLVFLNNLDINEDNENLVAFLQIHQKQNADTLLFATDSGQMKSELQKLGARIFPAFFLNTAGMKGKLVRLPQNLIKGLSLLRAEKPDYVLYDKSFTKIFKLMKLANRMQNDAAITFLSLPSLRKDAGVTAQDAGAH